MRKSFIRIIMIILLVLENTALIYIANLYQQQKQFNNMAKTNTGITRICKNLTISESLSFVLQQMKDFSPKIHIASESIYLDYGIEASEQIGVALLFDKDYKLTNKACNSQWEPSTPNLPFSPR